MATFDEIAVDLLLAGNQRGLTRLAKQAKRQLNNEVTCPECGDNGPHDDNGAIGAHLAYCCRGCGCHFDAQVLS